MKSTDQTLRSWLLALSAGTILSSSLTVLAVEYTWDSDTTAGIQNNSGAWGTFTPGASKWTIDGGATNVAWPNTGTDSALITGACTLNVSNLDIQVDDIKTTASGTVTLSQASSTTVVRTLTLTGGTYASSTPGSGSQFNVTSSILSIAGAVGTTQFNLAGNSDLVKLGGGSLYLASSNNTFTGKIYLNGGFTYITSGSDSTLGNAANVIEVNAGALSAQTNDITIGSGHTIRVVGSSSTNGRIGAAAPVTMTLQGPIAGGGSLNKISSGTLILEGAASYAGTTTISEGALRLTSTGTIPSSSNLIINGGGNFNIRNTIGWVYTGTITGNDTGSININTGTDAELAGDISGVLNINVGNLGTDATISGNISGGTNLNVQGSAAPILRLRGNNSHTGATTIANITSLILESANALSDNSALSIGNGTLDATVAGTDSTGTLDVTSTATIHLAADAKLAFLDSHLVDWAGGSLNITGTFVSGSSLRFGTDANGLDPAQLALITANGFSSFGLDANGFLTATSTGGYSAWQTANSTTETLDLDHDNDGVSNGVEYFLGGNSDTTGFTALPGVTDTAGVLSVTWTKAATGYTGAYTTDFVVETSDSLAAGSWVTAAEGTGPDTVDITSVPGEVKYTFPSGTKKFARLKVTMP